MFARVCVEIDLKELVVGNVCVEDDWFKVEYEGLHIICSKCGCYGHMGRDCAIQDSLVTETQPCENQEVIGRAVNALAILLERAETMVWKGANSSQ